eukprot:TCALIF_02488-PA protein Name:"Similar to trr Histone-lysine N-methyltransferase trr (Drosophila melanogaster)" AED:0.08 eAED:0.09 QI:0/-1/0/1/-1/1/1/0/1211
MPPQVQQRMQMVHGPQQQMIMGQMRQQGPLPPQMRGQIHPQHMQNRFRMQQMHPEQQQVRPRYPMPAGPMGADPMHQPIRSNMMTQGVSVQQGPPGMVGGPMQPRMPPPGMTNNLRLHIPPQGSMMPGAPGTPTSSQPSPSLTPRSESGEGDFMDINSSRGHTPCPGDPFENSGASTPTEGFYPNGEPPHKMLKRRTSQQKRRQSQGGKEGGPQAKKRARKGSKVDETDFDSYMESIGHQLKNLPPVQTIEPKLNHYYNACAVFGSGEMPKMFGMDVDTRTGCLEGSIKESNLKGQGDYYNVLPFGQQPPVPDIPVVVIKQRGFYKQEFENRHNERKPSDARSSSPDLFYCSSPEPEPVTKEREGVLKPWKDMEPDDSDEEMPSAPPEHPEIKEENDLDCKQDKAKAAKFIERPYTPDLELVKPIIVKPKPKQLITQKDLDEDNDEDAKENRFDDYISKAKAKSWLPNRTNGSFTSITMTIGPNGSRERVLKALNGLAKLLKIDAPKHWILEDKNGYKDVFRTRRIEEGDGESMELLNVLTSGSKLCRNCDMVLLDKKVKHKTTDLPFLSKQEREDCAHIYFCNSDCYFQFAINRTGGKDKEKVSSLDQLAEYQKEKVKEKERNERLLKKEDTSDGLETETHKGKTYRSWSSSLTQAKKYKKLNENDLTQMMFRMGLTLMPPREVDDGRVCLFCHMRGDAAADGPARLLNYDVGKWVHLNCALWSEEVYETVSGALVNVETALKNGASLYCKLCEKNGATVKCWKVRCTNTYHVGCANKDRATFYKNKSVYCHQHTPKGEKDQELTTLAVYRRVYIERDENRQVAKVMTQGCDQHVMRIGSLIFLNIGQLLPRQLHNFHTQDYIFPIGFKVLRLFWSLKEVNKRCAYACIIAEKDGKPEFQVIFNEGHKEEERVFTDSTAKGAWDQVLTLIDQARRDQGLVKVFPNYISGEDLFGLNEPNITKVLESLPGIESLTDYNFKYGRNPLLELPLAVNPTGCARSEPKMHTNVKRVHNFQRSAGSSSRKEPAGNLGRAAKENVPIMIGLETTGPYSKNFVQSKSSQYRKMKQEWRQNVVLARSKIQGLGLYAARDLEKHQMIIEYIGEVIRSDLTDIREKRYEAANRGIYMFRLDDNRVLDATMCGGMARYINHSCDPNCVTECVEVDRDLHIIIFANRRIQRGEELCYDYKFDFEDDDRIPCLCGAHNCRKWMN